MRLFLAIDPPGSAVDEARAAAAPVRDRLPGLRWAPPDTQHLTVAFLGDVADERVAAVRAAVGHALARSKTMRLAFSGAGTFPHDRARARVLWLGVSGDLPALHHSQTALTQALENLGFPRPSRRYVPHLTLARCRVPTDLDGELGDLDEFTGQDWTAAQVVLYRSTLGATPRYHAIATWDLPSK